MQQKLCNDRNAMELYFEILKQIEPCMILDFGMCLEKFGIISRQFGMYEIERTIKMVGICKTYSDVIPIYRKVYDEIITIEELLHRDDAKVWDLIICPNAKQIVDSENQAKLCQWIMKNGKYLISNDIEFPDENKRKKTSLALGSARADLYYL